MSEDQFTKLFKYMQSEFAKIHSGFDEIDRKLDSLTAAVNRLVSSHNALMPIMAANVERYNRLSDKVYEHDQEITNLKKLVKA
jgi:SMC interacting uncharacterized protein involved in chromosome segregation